MTTLIVAVVAFLAGWFACKRLGQPGKPLLDRILDAFIDRFEQRQEERKNTLPLEKKEDKS